MKKLVRIALIAMASLSLVACSKTTGSTDTDATSTSGASDELSGTIVITGSTSVEKILNDMSDEFQALHPNVTIEYTGSGSSAGIKDTIARTNNVGASSRSIKKEEMTQGGDMKVITFAYDGIAVIVNPENTGVSNLTVDQLAGIYSGKIKNWSEVGGKDEGIFVISREESSGTRTAFEELIGLKDAGGLTTSAAVSEGNGPVQAGVAGNKYAIGYVSFSYINQSVKAVSVENVAPSAENAKAGTYKLARPFNFVYYEDNATPIGKAFLDFSVSGEGQACVEENGAIVVK